jgi:hypothetical protein
MPFSRNAVPTIRQARESRFRVQPHPCDMDYMHLMGTVGCAPVVSPGDTSAMGIFPMDAGKPYAGSAAPDTRTLVARTIDRVLAPGGVGVEHFINMVGRPSTVDLLDPTFRSLGFLGVSEMPEGKFFDCKTIEQCHTDDFTYLGYEVKREATTPSLGLHLMSLSSSDACGSFGILVDAASYPGQCGGVSPTQSCCMIDGAVAPLYTMLCAKEYRERPIYSAALDGEDASLTQEAAGGARATRFAGVMSFLDSKCNGAGAAPDPFSSPALDVGAVEAACAVVGSSGFYAVESKAVNNGMRKLRIGQIRDALNSILDAFVPQGGVGGSENAYISATTCTVALHAALRATTACTPAEMQAVRSSPPPAGQAPLSPFCTSYHAKALERGVVMGSSSASLYYFLSHTLQASGLMCACLQ